MAEPRKSSRSTKGVPPVRFREPEAELDDTKSSVSSLTSSASSTASRRRRAELKAAVRLAKLEQEFEVQQLKRQKRILQLELDAELASIEGDELESEGRPEETEPSTDASFQTCAESLALFARKMAASDDETDDDDQAVTERSVSAGPPAAGFVAQAFKTDDRLNGELKSETLQSRGVSRLDGDGSTADKATEQQDSVPAETQVSTPVGVDRTPAPVAVGLDKPSGSSMEITPVVQGHLGRSWPQAASDTARGKADRVSSWVQGVQSAPFSGISQHQIQPLELPKFDGSQKNYIRWRQKFLRLVDDDHMVSEDYKMARLREALEGGTADDLIADLLDGPGAYSAALKELDEWYGSNDRELERQQQELLALPRITSERDSDKLQQLAVRLRNVLLNMSTASLTPGRDLYIAITQKLPRGMLTRFVESHDDSLTNVKTLSTWLMKRVHTLRQVDARLTESDQDQKKPALSKPPQRPAQNRPWNPRGAERSYAAGPPKQSAQCLKCSGSHPLERCPAFEKMSVPDRWQLVKSSSLCICCFRPGHRAYKCDTGKCTVCQKTHHAMLHIEQKGSASNTRTTAGASANGTPTSEKVTYHASADSVLHPSSSTTFIDDGISFMTVPVLLKNEDRVVECTALFDSGSTASYIQKDVAGLLGIQPASQPLKVQTLGGNSVSTDASQSTVTISSIDGSYVSSLDAWVLPQVTGDSNIIEWHARKSSWDHLREIDFPVSHSKKIGILIGLNATPLHKALEERCGPPGSPVARLTPLGWVCYGPTSAQADPARVATHCAVRLPSDSVKQADDRLDDLVKDLWNVESVGLGVSPTYRTPAELEAEAMTTATLSYSGGRYCVGIPWRSADGPKVRNNRPMAERRLRSQERSLEQKPHIAAEYNRVLVSHMAKGYIRQVPAEEVAADGEDQWFVPHFPIVRQDKVTTKVRVVFDAAVSWSGCNLNEEMHAGPPLQSDLVHILLRFCMEPVAIVADISEMFLQVGLRPDDRKYTRFLWRKDNNSEPEVFEFNRLVFGMKASPYLATRALRQTAEDFSSSDRDDSIDIPTLVNKAFYVDDLLHATQDESQAVEIQQKLDATLSKGGFHLRKWHSNSAAVLAAIPPADRAPQAQVMLEDAACNAPPVSKTLGVTWMADKDQFTFVYNAPAEDYAITKRSVLRKMATIFDPRGQLPPFTIRARILFQEACIAGNGWDDPLSTTEVKKWKTWFAELPDLTSVSVDRCFKLAGALPQPCATEVHTFTDASDAAFAAASYVRVTYPDGQVKVTLCMAKSRPTPIKKMSIPKLELKAAALGVRLSTEVATALDIPVAHHFFWTDNMNVLFWVRSHSRKFATDVGVKIAEIQTVTSGKQWQHVPGKSNPADLPTRGMTASSLAACDEWWQGPSFLQAPPSQWPNRDIVVPTNLPGETKRHQASSLLATGPSIDRLQPDRYSSWIRLKRVTAWCRRFFRHASKGKCCRQDTPQTGGSAAVEGTMVSLEYQRTRKPQKFLVQPLTVTELESAEDVWFAKAQQDEFNETIEACRSQRPIPASSPLLRLQPVLDDSNPQLLRMEGRLSTAHHLPSSLRRPVILPTKHPVTALVIAHEDAAHNHTAGVNHLLSTLNSKFWIVHGPAAVKRHRSQCTACKKIWAKPAQQLMAPLPDFRTEEPFRAFSRVGVDYAGSFLTKQGRGRSRAKRYLCLMTCLQSRAVHLEMAYGLDTESFLLAFTRFAKRRGVPDLVVSDNGTNFVSAERELREAIESLKNSQIAATMA